VRPASSVGPRSSRRCGAERCRLVAIVGIGGIGKTSLAARLARDLASSFELVYWRSVRTAPSVGEWLAAAIGFLSDHRVVPPVAHSERLTTLLQLLRERRCLLVLDNFETLFEPGPQVGLYRPGLDGYGRLLLAVGESAHRSCLVLTSREAPEERAVFQDGGGRTLQLGGLGAGEAQALLAAKQLVGTRTQWTELVVRFGGNSLALKLVGETIHERFGGDIGRFLDSAAWALSSGRTPVADRPSQPGVAAANSLVLLAPPARMPLTSVD
jgi:NACHT domain